MTKEMPTSCDNWIGDSQQLSNDQVNIGIATTTKALIIANKSANIYMQILFVRRLRLTKIWIHFWYWFVFRAHAQVINLSRVWIGKSKLGKVIIKRVKKLWICIKSEIFQVSPSNIDAKINILVTRFDQEASSCTNGPFYVDVYWQKPWYPNRVCVFLVF